MVFLDLTKDLQRMGDDGWNRSWMKSNSFGAKHDILVPKMTECYIPGKSKCRPSSITFWRPLHVELFNTVNCNWFATLGA